MPSGRPEVQGGARTSGTRWTSTTLSPGEPWGEAAGRGHTDSLFDDILSCHLTSGLTCHYSPQVRRQLLELRRCGDGAGLRWDGPGLHGLQHWARASGAAGSHWPGVTVSTSGDGHGHGQKLQQGRQPGRRARGRPQPTDSALGGRGAQQAGGAGGPGRVGRVNNICNILITFP